eukprot:s12_g11.t1
MALQTGSGIWCLAETHLTAALQRSVSANIVQLGRQQNRQIRTHFGAPVAFRTNSSHAGTWSGVGILSDFPSREIALSWQHGERSSGRLMVTRHLVGCLPIMVGAVYGFPAGPTWPESRELTSQLLTTLTQDMVVSGAGPRIIAGDYNCSLHQLDMFQIWQSYGWTEVQLHAHSCWQRPVVPTCKGSTTIDMIWMSPEAARLCRAVGYHELFPDHITLYADFDVPTKLNPIWTWPRPTSIPWDQIDHDKWHENLATQPMPDMVNTASTPFFAAWAQHWEQALDGCVQNQQHGHLAETFRGRAQRTKPLKASPVPPISKSSREGEVCLRSDLISTQVHHWFKQLRRLQSYRHAALANKLTIDAEIYRLQLWMAIKRGRGFDGDFTSWWMRRLHRSQEAPAQLPLAPPAGSEAEAIFLDFKRNFEAFEQWHLRQRRKLLQLKYDKCCHRLFRELKPPLRQQLDMLWHIQDFTVLAIDFETHQLHVDQPVDGLSGCVWYINHVQVEMTAVEGCVWYINHVQVEMTAVEGEVLSLRQVPAHVEPGDLLQCHRYFSDAEQVQQALMDLWRPRWQQASLVGTVQWERIMGFVQAYMPQMHFPAPDYSLDKWKMVLDQFPPRPARGVDGIDVADLKHLPPAVNSHLLEFLSQIDGTTTPWPDQLLFVHFRPVVILGTVYRAWSRLCALPLLQMFSHVVPMAAHGFLPGRECAQVWLQLQGFIEVCLQQGIEFSGFSTDIEKCFNNVGRDSLMALAGHVGICQSLLKPWRAFLDTFARSFQVQTALGVSTLSTQGLPEGCSLSVAGMVLIDWAYHVYMAALTPSVHAFSYVDNVSTAGHVVMEVVSAFFSTLCFFQLCGLTLDIGKTYFWSTSSASRAVLKLLGMSLQQDALELGGSMTFAASRRNKHLRQRGENLHGKWARLKRSLAPLAQKHMVLPMAFWSSALYGAAACPLADTYIHQLRQEANKALRCKHAGSNALLRFSMSDKMDADPGFFHIISVVQTFRRVCGRSPHVLDCWRLWKSSFEGTLTHGPFGILMDVMNKLGWNIGIPPLVYDRQGLAHDLLLAPWPMLRHLLEESWLCYVAASLNRPSMKALQGIDNYDLRDSFSLTDEIDEIPQALALHLLCPCSPWLDDLRFYYYHLPDVTDVFDSGPYGDEVQHLFSDGSLFHDGRVELRRAAWGLYNSTSALPISGGWLPGILQTIMRAELTALISALRWALHWQHSVHLWTDALEIHKGFQQRLDGKRTLSTDSNADLWLIVDELLDQGANHLVATTWIPAHLDLTLCESPMEEWIAVNNGIADSMAVQINMNRPQPFQELLALAKHWDDRHVSLMRRLRQFFFAIFERNKKVKPVPASVLVESSDSADESEVDPLSFPFRDPVCGEWKIQDRWTLFERPTIAYFYGIVQKVLGALRQRGSQLSANTKRRFSGGGFGSPKDHEPAWIERWSENRREGQDNLDWFFRAFNSTRIYEIFLKSSPRFYGFIVWTSIIGGYCWSRMWDHIWDYVNQGKLYRHNPYVYPVPDDDEWFNNYHLLLFLIMFQDGTVSCERSEVRGDRPGISAV